MIRKTILLLFISSQFLFCQVNTEKYRNFNDSSGFNGIIKLDASIQTGNIDLQKFGSEINFNYITHKSTALLILKGEYGWKNGEQFSNGALAHLRFVKAINLYLKWEIFTQTNYNKSIFLLFRALGGTGLRYKLFSAFNSVLWFGSSYMLEYERYQKPRIIIDMKNITASRWSNYLSFNLIIQNNVSLSSVIYYQPRIDLFKDARILTESSLLIKLSSNFTLSVEFDLRYDRFPALELKKVDTNSKLGFAYSF